jgi:hypothetical protein
MLLIPIAATIAQPFRSVHFFSDFATKSEAHFPGNNDDHQQPLYPQHHARRQ